MKKQYIGIYTIKRKTKEETFLFFILLKCYKNSLPKATISSFNVVGHELYNKKELLFRVVLFQIVAFLNENLSERKKRIKQMALKCKKNNCKCSLLKIS